MIKRTFLFASVVISVCGFAYADDYMELISYRDSLKQQIATIDSEIARCEKSMKTWKTITVVGGVGAVASGIGIIAQTQQMKKNKKSLQKISEDAKDAHEMMNFIKKVKE